MTLDNPQLLIVAGPNGAGKSTFSKDLSAAGAFIFDADKEAAKIEARYPGLPGESVSYAVEQYFLDCVVKALDNKTDFTVETNFRDAALMNTVNRFKENDYVVNIVYIGLSDVKQSMDRVGARVKGGGHFVDTGSIHYNYIEGLKNFEYFADRFDNLEFIDASENLYELRLLLSVQNRQVVFVSNDLPKWAKPVISSIVKQFNPSLPKRDDDNKYRRGRRR
ncbi:zeta toxin family protein [Mucilaginibacter sp. cycad4]|uniref:zeta toxin family protein n=1 Tax=Mucilaginibacter sp. cycad4 TaxID=3342096 RepID=UPI002AAB4DBA|nr:AAA family ATPase [Mucilaginibacter gossypii]WPV00729.1 zeta toxin family protein [Mucilaginibacter gossypii]